MWFKLYIIPAHAKSDAAALGVPTWHPRMLWFGPGGIGSTGLTVARYQRQGRGNY